MLPDVAAEMLHFLTRGDLDKASGVSKWLDTMIAQCCEVYPLRPVRRVAVLLSGNGYTPTVSIYETWSSLTDRSFSSVEEAVYFAASASRHSYIEGLVFGDYYRPIALSPDQWATLIDALRSAAVRLLGFDNVDLSAICNDVAVECRGLRSFEVQRCGFVTDELIRSSAAKSFSELSLCGNKSDSPHRISEEALVDWFLTADAAAERYSLSLELEGIGITDTFLTKIFERLRESRVRPSGSLKFYGAPKQRGLAAYARYMEPNGAHAASSIYSVPSIDDDSKYYEVEVYESSTYILLRFQVVYHCY